MKAKLRLALSAGVALVGCGVGGGEALKVQPKRAAAVDPTVAHYLATASLATQWGGAVAAINDGGASTVAGTTSPSLLTGGTNADAGR